MPAAARHADIWHTFVSDTDVYRPKSKVVGELATVAGNLLVSDVHADRAGPALNQLYQWWSAHS